MWIPTSASEIETAIAQGDVQETAAFDAKRALPEKPKKNIDVAVDVSAMSTDGGVLIYGVAEDENEALTIPSPISLAGAAERISQIVASGVSEVPHMEIRELPLEEDPSHGYLVVIVPQSVRAPHQVQIGGDHRYYGRDAQGNRKLTEGDVARLYERRERWEIDRQGLLVEAVGLAPYPAHDDLSYLHAFVRPVAPDPAIFHRASEKMGGRLELQRHFSKLISKMRLVGHYDPALHRALNWRQLGADAWRLRTSEEKTGEDNAARFQAQMEMNVDGRANLFVGRAGERESRNRLGVNDPLMIFESIIAGNLAAFFRIEAELFKLAEYHGQVDLGLSITGVRDGFSARQAHASVIFDAGSYQADVYPRTDRRAAGELLDSEALVLRIVGPFFNALTGIEGYDPFDGK